MNNKKTKENQQFIANAIINYFDRNDWTYRHDPENNSYSGEICINGPLGSVNFVVFADNDAAVCYHMLPFSASVKERRLLAEYLARVNISLYRGAFELDFTDGEIRNLICSCPCGSSSHRSGNRNRYRTVQELGYHQSKGNSVCECGQDAV